MNSKLSKILKLSSKLPCDFHLRNSAGFGVAVYGWRLLYRLCILGSYNSLYRYVSGSSNCLYRCIGELQLPVLLHRRVATPRFDHASGRILFPKSVPMLFVTFMARSHCLTTDYIIDSVETLLHCMGSRFFTFFNLLFFSRFCVSISGRSDINLWFRRKL